MTAWLASLAQTETVRWIRPPRGTLRHGVLWSTHPWIVAAVTLALVLGILAAAIYRRFRRR